MAAGKYAKVLPNLAPYPVADLQYQERVNICKTELLKTIPRQGSALAKKYAELRLEKDELEAKEKVVNLEIEAITQLLVDQYEAEGTSTLKLESGESVAVQLEPYAVVEDRDKFRTWCIENGLERSLMLMWQTTNSLTKERLLGGLPEPDGVTSYSKPKLVLRKG